MSAAQTPPEPKPPSDGRVRALVTVTIETLNRLPPVLAGLVYVAFLAALIALVAIGLAAFNANAAGYCIGGALAVILLVLWAFYAELKKEVRWSRHVPSSALLGP